MMKHSDADKGNIMRHDFASLSRKAIWLWAVGGLTVVGIILLSGAMFWTAFVTGVERQPGGYLRADALEVVEATAELRSSIRDRHKVLKAYATSQTDILLSFYDRGKVEEDFARLDDRKNLSKIQRARIDAIGAVLRGYATHAEILIEQHGNGRDVETDSWLASGDAEMALLQVDELLDEVEAEEERIFRVQNGLMVTAAEDSERYVLILGFLGVAVLGLAGGAIGFVIALSANLRVRDIESKLMEEVRSSEERMRIALEGTGAGTWEYDIQSGVLTWSREMFRLFGRDVSLGVPTREEWLQIVHPEDLGNCPWIYPDRVFRSGSLMCEYRVRTESGYQMISCRGALLDGEGDRVRAIGMEIDVTEANQTKDELSRLYALLSDETASIRRDRERIFEMTADLMAVGRADGRLLSVNPAWTKVLGYSEAALREMAFGELFCDAEIQIWDAVRADLGALHPVLDLVAPMRAEDGSIRHVSWTIVPEGDDDGARIFAVGRDVTEQMRSQDKLREAEGQIHQMKKIEMIGQMTGGVAHDFNNLLTPIVGYLDFLQRRLSDDPKALRMISAAQQSAERGRVLVSRLLSFARRQHLETRVVELSELVGGMRDLIARSIGAEIELEISVDAALPNVEIDPNQLELALLNLAVNARDAMPDGGDLNISVAKAVWDETLVGHGLAAGDYVVIAVKDNGIGMDEAQLERAVEPFFSTKAVGKGTGLGLSMVHGLAAQSGGALVLESKVGEGTSATIWLPASSEISQGSNEVGGGVVALKTEQQLRVLVVDDNDLVLESMKEMLLELGHDVMGALSGAEALAAVKDGGPFDLLVTDYSMPSMTGIELILEVLKVNPEIGTLVVSGYSDVNERFDSPGLVRLAKPFSMLRLSSAVSDAMGSARGERRIALQGAA